MEQFVLVWGLAAVCASYVASRKGRRGVGWTLLAVFGGILALLIAIAVSPADQPTDSLSSHLEELKRQRQLGLISAANYHYARERLLD